MYTAFHPALQQAGMRYVHLLEDVMSGRMGAEELEARRLAQLKDVIARARAGSPFYAERLRKFDADEAGTRLDALVRRLPFTTKEDLRDAGLGLCSEPPSHAWIYYETTGTTGPSTPCPRNEADSLRNNAFLTLRYRDLLGDGRRVVGVMGPSELHSTGDTFEDVLRSLGHATVKMWPRSPVVGMGRVQRLIRDLGITALVCTPAVAAELWKHLVAGGADPRRSGVAVILVLGELITPHRLRGLARAWNAAVYNCMYASQEASILAACGADGRLETMPLNVYYEVVSPETGASLAVGEAEVAGEMVVTHLYEGAKPLLRYRTGDLVRCRASNHGRWVVQPIGRVRDVISIAGRPVHAFDLENAIFEDLDGCFEYAVAIDRAGNRDVLRVTLEAASGADEGPDLERLRRRLEGRFGATVETSVGEAGKIAGTGAMVSWKAARIHDLRQAGVDPEREAALAIAKGR